MSSAFRALLISAVCAAGPLHAQVRWHVTGTAGLTDFRPAPLAPSVTEFRLERVLTRLTVATADGRWRAFGSLVAEGLTMRDGVLNAGAFGEGLADRRHPHTYVHELGGSLVVPAGPLRLSVTAGKGFVAFGTDDPMHRPALKYPVNHHWAQILERMVTIGAVAAGPLLVEGTLFNGDEPEAPEQWPVLRRFGDSWAVRLTVVPGAGVETQVSHAAVASPEHRGGAGPDASKWSASAAATSVRGSAQVEWARTTEANRAFHSWLVEAEGRLGRHRPYARVERTDRPEEERTLDPFVTRRPHLDDHLLGVTRWSILTVGHAVRFPVGAVTVEPLVEFSLARVQETTGGLFDPARLYGDDTIRSVTLALRLHWGTASRMGRYGIRETLPEAEHHH